MARCQPIHQHHTLHYLFACLDEFLRSDLTIVNSECSTDSDVHNVGSVVASSMATLASSGSGGDPNQDYSYENTALVNDFIYGNCSGGNVSTSGNVEYVNNSGEYILNELLSSEEIGVISEQQAGYHRQHESSSSYGNQSNVKQTSDRMDTSSDSAVSSMSGGAERASEDWIDTCSEASSQHGGGDAGYTSASGPYQYGYATGGSSPSGAASNTTSEYAHKKYKLFGRGSKSSGCGSSSIVDETLQLSMPHNYYASSASMAYESGNDSYVNSGVGGYYHESDQATGVAFNGPAYQSVEYQQGAVAHNHSYSHDPASATAQELAYHEELPPSASSPSSITFPKSTEPKSFARSIVPIGSLPRRTTSVIKTPFVDEDCLSRDSYNSDDAEAQASRDERRARALNIPIVTCDIINLPIDEFNERLAKYDLTEAQLSLIRDIRRRGKNKVS